MSLHVRWPNARTKIPPTHVPESGQTPFQSDTERNYMEDVTGWRCFAVEEVRAALACQTVNVLEQLLALAVEMNKVVIGNS